MQEEAANDGCVFKPFEQERREKKQALLAAEKRKRQ